MKSKCFKVSTVTALLLGLCLSQADAGTYRRGQFSIDTMRSGGVYSYYQLRYLQGHGAPNRFFNQYAGFVGSKGELFYQTRASNRVKFWGRWSSNLRSIYGVKRTGFSRNNWVGAISSSSQYAITTNIGLR
ncbi:hypothetical protein [Gimesia fumaroli]|uniref:Uncharacterized protein n=1 Tax=Gimesia fumaroli TaxID=2527976 RepID=A0A518I551_9PLAN|nr:hypothetical protein [Gimesia fumaroli]QDV48183.1 hypothetical protein Enr17x_01920 [Gimesia fumaroli]